MELLLLFGVLAVGALVVFNLTSTVQRGDAGDEARSGDGARSSREP